MTRTELPHIASLLVLVAALPWGSTVGAATREVTNMINAAGICQSALPVFDGVIRKRPLAIQNEGTSESFVTCPMLVSYSGHLPTRVKMYASTNNGVASTVTCTAVPGYQGFPRETSTKTYILAANGSPAEMEWSPADFTGSTTVLPSPFFSLSCLLTPGSGLNDTYIYFDADVGA